MTAIKSLSTPQDVISLKNIYRLGGYQIHALCYGQGTNCIHAINRGWEVTTFDPHQNYIVRHYRLPIEAGTCAAWTLDGLHLAVGTWRGVEIFDALTAERIVKTRQHIQIVSCVAWSKWREYLAIGVHSIKIWDSASEEYAFSLDGHKHSLATLTWSKDNRLLASADSCGGIFVWDMETGKPLFQLQSHTTCITSLAWSSDARYLAIPGSLKKRDDGISLSIFDLEKGEIAAEFSGHWPKALRFRPIGEVLGNLLISKSQNEIRIWRCDNWKCVAVIPENSSNYVAVPVEFYPLTNAFLTLDDGDTSIRLWEYSDELLQRDTPYTPTIENVDIVDLTTSKLEENNSRHLISKVSKKLLDQVNAAKTSEEKGKSLETLCSHLFSSIHGFEVKCNVNTSTEEIDFIIRKWTKDIAWLESHAFYVLGECKNWSGKCGKNEYVLFKEKLQNRRSCCNLGFLISWNGFTSTAELESLRGSHEGLVIGLLTGDDLQEAIEKGNFLDVIFQSYEKAVMK